MKNIIYSTTRQWNPGDEFILMGIENLLNSLIGEHNSIIYNRSPHVKPNFPNFRKHPLLRIILQKLYRQAMKDGDFLDNSLKNTTIKGQMDLVVFAGSPEWSGKKLTDLYSFILDKNLPTVFLGLGSVGKKSLKNLTDDEIKVLSESQLIICRDSATNNLLQDFRSYYLPCPALFASPITKSINSVKKIAILYGTSKAAEGNNISKETEVFMKNIYSKLLEKYSEKYQFEFVAHYIDEVEHFYSDYSREVLRYNYKSDAYIEIFRKYDLVIGHRVHGIGLCASIGIPGIMISHDPRAETVKGFLAEMVSLNESYETFDNIFANTINMISEKNKILIEHKNNTKLKYLGLLSKNLSFLLEEQ